MSRGLHLFFSREAVYEGREVDKVENLSQYSKELRTLLGRMLSRKEGDRLGAEGIHKEPYKDDRMYAK